MSEPTLVIETARFAGKFRAICSRQALLAMQKVEGSNPFSRSRETTVLQVFSLAAVALFLRIRSD
jgi:hypothetical protein